jgi:hypothetical protein
MTMRVHLLILALWATGSATSWAHPEFQKYVASHSGRPVNCALCHTHADGPEGTAPGQVGRLTSAEMEALGRARGALEPGGNVDSPILNGFGDHIINCIGKKKFMELRVVPAELANLLPADSDLDRDGIPDVREYLDGTHPLKSHDGSPWLLFRHNFRQNLPQILLTLAATICGLYALRHLLQAFANATRAHEEEGEES